jgi:hypothetical protein
MSIEMREREMENVVDNNKKQPISSIWQVVSLARKKKDRQLSDRKKCSDKWTYYTHYGSTCY